MKPSFIGLFLLKKQMKPTREASWNGPLVYQWIKKHDCVCEAFRSLSVCCLYGAGFTLILLNFLLGENGNGGFPCSKSSGFPMLC